MGDAVATKKKKKKDYTSHHHNTASVETRHGGRPKYGSLNCRLSSVTPRSPIPVFHHNFLDEIQFLWGSTHTASGLLLLLLPFFYPVPPPVLPGCASALCPFAGRRIHPYSVNLFSHALLCQEREESRAMRQMTAVWSSEFRSGLASLVAV